MRVSWVKVKVALAAGCGVSVLVAWGIEIARAREEFALGTSPTLMMTPMFIIPDPRQAGTSLIYSYEKMWGRQTWAVAHLPVLTDEPTHERPPLWLGRPDETRNETRWTFAYGWPLACMRHECVLRRDGPQTWARMKGLQPFRSSSSELVKTRLPFMPIWSGLAVNTLLYGVAVLGVMLGVGYLRLVASGYYRIRRGRCAFCGYDLKGEFGRGCPECGKVMSPSARRA